MSSGRHNPAANSYRTGVLIGNWSEDRIGGDAFKPTASQMSQGKMVTTQKQSYPYSGAKACVDILNSRNDPLPTAAHCVEKGLLFTHKGGSGKSLSLNRGLLAKKRDQWGEDSKSNSRGGSFQTSAKSHFKGAAASKPRRATAPRSQDNVFPDDTNKSERFKTTNSISYAK